MARFYPKPQPEPEPILEPLDALTLEEQKIILWHIEVLCQDGLFEAWWAGKLAGLGDLDWREAVKLRKAGCSQPLVYELLK